MSRIYCVEDDANIRELIVYALKSNNYDAIGFENSKDLYSQMEISLPDLILLDIMLPGEDGLNILKKIRNQPTTKYIPVIMITAKTSEYDKVIGLDMGADDYIPKPFGVMELIARIKALLRRTSVNSNKNILTIDAIDLIYEKRMVLVNNTPVQLTYKEFELLYYLLQNRDIVLSRDNILNEIWGVDFQGETRTVDVHIGTLRQKLGKSGNLIQTIRNVGYKIGDL